MRLRKRAYRALMELRRRLLRIPPPGQVNFGDLRRTGPISRHFGADRGIGGGGQAVDRFYIERFLQEHAADVGGRVLEVGENTYTCRFGGDRVTRSDVLHVVEGNPRATIVADLAAAPQISDDTFDCIILTQTLQYLYDAPAAVRTLHRILKPGGVLLLTVPCLTPVPAASQWGYTWYWSFTPLAIERMLGDAFGAGAVEVQVGGNVLSAVAFLHGLSTAEMAVDELEASDPDYPVNIAARARKAPAGA
jgi:SAM-dependent methyltransferase